MMMDLEDKANDHDFGSLFFLGQASRTKAMPQSGEVQVLTRSPPAPLS